ncbi:hypothetical protein MUG78_00260 [Gordonia alkaliphila]|uniref:hypothetical protein n=1 Tax=Gordonia alkaliphila TaxID=1053547 RepID=UPI001FF4357F|nr:hypothetical protein [Gordonia alkaliphila]MCK0437931.1 hypothetical protein [Gordonia alkaliphila]
MTEEREDDFVGCDTWAAMVSWLAESLPEIPVGVTIDFGPKDMLLDDVLDADDFEDDPLEALCAQIVVLQHGRFLVRRSRVVMEANSYISHDASAATPNRWFEDDPAGDCTAGAIYVDDAHLAAEICVTWLSSESRDEGPLDFGFDVSEAIPLPGIAQAEPAWTIDDFLRRLGH